MSWERKPLEEHEAESLVTAATDLGESHELVIQTLIHTGMRAAEFGHMEHSWGNWMADERGIEVQATDDWQPKSAAGQRLIPLRNPDVIRLLRQYFSENQEIGLSRTTIWRRVRSAADHAGLDKMCSPHVLRHTFGTRLAARGATAQFIKQVMGHRHLETSQQYIEFSGRRLHKEADDILR
jgi:integrase/recombinase XerD